MPDSPTAAQAGSPDYHVNLLHGGTKARSRLPEALHPPLLTMNTARLARSLNTRALSSRSAVRSYATTTSTSPIIPVSNIEAQWEQLSQQEQLEVYEALLDAQKRDWKTLSLDEKKAG